MKRTIMSRREVVAGGLGGLAAWSVAGPPQAESAATRPVARRGRQRLEVEVLQRWESLQYGMFITFGISTFLGQEFPDGRAPATAYAPDQLDVDQWVSVARDAGMKYAVLTAKHVAGHCLWPSRHTDYTVANSTDKTDVVGKFVEACRQREVLPVLYYCSWDNRHRFGSRTPSDPGGTWDFSPAHLAAWSAKAVEDPAGSYLWFTTSTYQMLQTAQVEELLRDYGPLLAMWIDTPGVLGRGYREYLYRRIAELQPQALVVMNSGSQTGADFNIDFTWPSDVITIEFGMPPEEGHQPWRTIEGNEYYLPAEKCSPLGKHWFWMPDDPPRPDEELARQWEVCRRRKVNFLLNAPPDRHGRIPREHVEALMRLRKNVNL